MRRGRAFFYFKGRRISDLHVQISRDSGGGYIFPDYDFTMKAWAKIHMRHRACAVPYMYGGGGNLVVCMPNGLVGFALADNLGAEWDAAAIRTMIGAAHRIKPL